jgi:hypothetical protein
LSHCNTTEPQNSNAEGQHAAADDRCKPCWQQQAVQQLTKDRKRLRQHTGMHAALPTGNDKHAVWQDRWLQQDYKGMLYCHCEFCMHVQLTTDSCLFK